jgi:hypothetical protein
MVYTGGAMKSLDANQKAWGKSAQMTVRNSSILAEIRYHYRNCVQCELGGGGDDAERMGPRCDHPEYRWVFCEETNQLFNSG